MLILAYDWREPLKNVICTPDCIIYFEEHFCYVYFNDSRGLGESFNPGLDYNECTIGRSIEITYVENVVMGLDLIVWNYSFVRGSLPGIASRVDSIHEETAFLCSLLL